VDQLALPYRIAMVALLAFAGLWFVALRPKSGSGTKVATPAAQSQPTAPGVKGLTNAIAKAHGASAASDAANARIQAATGGSSATAPSATATGPATAAAKPATATAKPAPIAGVAPGDLSAPLIAALAKHRVVVLVFAGTSAVDRSVTRAVHGLSRQHGKVVVKVAPIGQVGRYAAITRGAQVGGAPTTLVIAPDRTAETIVGYTGKAEIRQAVGDALASAKKK
jgi:hypothetical protein